MKKYSIKSSNENIPCFESNDYKETLKEFLKAIKANIKKYNCAFISNGLPFTLGANIASIVVSDDLEFTSEDKSYFTKLLDLFNLINEENDVTILLDKANKIISLMPTSFEFDGYKINIEKYENQNIISIKKDDSSSSENNTNEFLYTNIFSALNFTGDRFFLDRSINTVSDDLSNEKLGDIKEINLKLIHND